MTTRPMVRLSEDDRFELSLGAASRARRNRPVGTVVIAGALLAVSVVFALYSVGARAKSRGGLVRAQQDQAKTDVLIDQWKRLMQAEAAGPKGGAGQPGVFKVSKMEDLATKAGMKSKPNTPRSLEDKTRPGIVTTRYIYSDVRDPELKSLLEWVRSGCAEIPGLELESLTLKPEPTGWKLDATFRIWERAGT